MEVDDAKPGQMADRYQAAAPDAQVHGGHGHRDVDRRGRDADPPGRLTIRSRSWGGDAQATARPRPFARLDART
jgi:hypothetical protein